MLSHDVGAWFHCDLWSMLIRSLGTQPTVRADLGGHLKYSQHWSGVCAGVLLGVQGAVRRGESRGGL